MSWPRVRYRIRQFFHALQAEVDPVDLERARSVLTPAQMTLFLGMQPSEQAHALSVYRQLLSQGETAPDLGVAALLHDVGKSCRPLRLWERVWIVLVRAVLPEQTRRWGRADRQMGKGPFWKQAFVVAEQHPAWGADLAARAGASPRAVALIRLHQDIPPAALDGEIKRLLFELQAVDDHT
jgi:hypothetical protein